ncbi:AbrB/MazE/SpoVT family DNA-binding domain-containing protein [Thermus caliditerrae]|uniref:AbrB/MazE/SpoVT family DNA-binding domain-containing protein n=1 Tax=Thermus caliditerrae TaxID=1330700 RepID=UPI00056E56B1|nr:AbrB/MazE/SpoVT family DNA-binding domain-containing protein [Thermus caliditerrae]
MTLPKQVREILGVGPGEEVAFEVREGEVVIRARKRVPLEALLGRFRGLAAYPGEEEERRAREAAWSQRDP